MDALVLCPSCGEEIELFVDEGGGVRQDVVEDCPVCCRPMMVTVRSGADDGEPRDLEGDEDDGAEGRVTVRRLDE